MYNKNVYLLIYIIEDCSKLEFIYNVLSFIDFNYLNKVVVIIVFVNYYT